eukprot:TRINITY_DN21320_c0_g1_i1.p1 TRINITY_DN21320_c0_g1~~TRINITY_DN21320_c0_g1_i1.p1  ORF type:complete len:1263 (+),score=334.07 TRINITY_DN21320_c0_g1_i1:35-3823(+)
MQENDAEIEDLLDKELSLISIGVEERVPCRDFEYPVVRWSEQELRAKIASPLLSDDPLALQGCSVGVEKGIEKTKVLRKVIPVAAEEDVDLSMLDDPVTCSNGKWASTVDRFKQFLGESEQQTIMLRESIEGLYSLELPIHLTNDKKQAPQTPEQQDEDLPSDTNTPDDVLHLSDISDDEERSLVDEKVLEELQQRFREEVEALKKQEEQQKKETLLRCEEEFKERILEPEEKLTSIKQKAAPLDINKALRVAEDTMQRDVEFTSNLKEAEERIDRDIAEAKEELQKIQEEQHQRRKQDEEERQKEEEIRNAKENKQLEAMRVESRRMKLIERKQYRMVKEQSEKLKMEAADIESMHSLVLIQEKKNKERALQLARLARQRAEHDDMCKAEHDLVFEEEACMRSALEKDQEEAYKIFCDPFTALCDYAAKLLQQRYALLTKHGKQAALIAKEELSVRTAFVDWSETNIKAWLAEVSSFYNSEDTARSALRAHEMEEMRSVIQAAEADHYKVEEVLINIDLAKKKREAFQTCEKETSEGVIELSTMFSSVATPASAVVSGRLSALRLQSSLRSDWLQFSNPDAVTVIRKRRILPVEGTQASGASRQSTPSPHPPLKEEANVLSMDHFRRGYTLCKLGSLENVSITFEKLTKVVGPFPELVNLAELDLSNNVISSFSGFIHSLRCLDLTDNKMTCTAFLSNLPNLQRVKLDANNVSNLSRVEECQRLKELSARHNCISEATNLKECVSLVSLDLFGNNLTSVAVPDVSSLTYVNVGRNALTDVSNILRSCTVLLEAHFYNNRITSLPSRIHNVLLQSLLLSDNLIEKIPDLSHLPLLTMLDVSSNKLHDASGVRGCLHLEVLNLAFNDLTDAECILVPCKTLSRLQRLDINDNPLWEQDTFGLLKDSFVRCLPSLRSLNSCPVEEPEKANVFTPNDVSRIVSMCLPVGTTPTVDDEAHALSCYDDLCMMQIKERRRVANDIRQGTAPQHSLEDMTEQQVQAHATHGVTHLQHKFRTNPLYGKKREQFKRQQAASRICKWVRGRKERRRMNRAAVTVQAAWLGYITRKRLRDNTWVDSDTREYGKVSVDFGQEVDTSGFKHMGEILGAALARNEVPVPKDMAPFQTVTASVSVPMPTPPPEPKTPLKDAMRERQHSPPQTEEPQLGSATLAWSSGMMKREKKFEKIKKRRMTEERFIYDRSKTLQSRKSLIEKNIQQAASATTSVKKPDPPVDLEVESLSSTLSTLGDHKSLKKTTSLPPLNRSL